MLNDNILFFHQRTDFFRTQYFNSNNQIILRQPSFIKRKLIDIKLFNIVPIKSRKCFCKTLDTYCRGFLTFFERTEDALRDLLEHFA